MLFPLLVFADPTEVFKMVEHKRPWLAAIGYCTLGMFIITWLGGCWENISDGLRWWSLLGPAFFSPLTVGIGCLASTLVLYSALQIGAEWNPSGPGFRSFFSLNIHCILILILGEVVNFLLIHTGFMQNLELSFTNRFPLGLDLLILGAKEPNIYLNIILHSTSVFIVWYLVVLARGIQHLSGVSTGRAAMIVGSLWLVGVAFALSLVYALGGGTTIRVIL